MPTTSDRGTDACKTEFLRSGLFAQSPDPAERSISRVLFWVALSLALLVVSFLIDAPVARLLSVASSKSMTQIAWYFSKAGEGWIVAVAGAVCSTLLFFGRKFDASRAVFIVALTGLLTGAAATVIRSLLGRTRPDAHELQGFYGVWHDSHWIIGRYEFGAFPSGHAATVIGFAAAAWLIDRRFGLFAGIYALLVSWSRIALDCHHFSDVVASAILGIYGANLILERLGPSVYLAGHYLQSVWLGRRGPQSKTGSV
jgi:membrane-associated phospholipid phosphatase